MMTDQSTHGSFVNGTRILKRSCVLLKHDKLRIGQHEFVLDNVSLLIFSSAGNDEEIMSFAT